MGLFPATPFPRLRLNFESGDRRADQMLLLVSTPVEQAIRRVPGVSSVRSISSRGSSEITVDFDWKTDMVAAMLQVDAATAQVLPRLPAGTTYVVRRMDPTVFPIIAYGLISDEQSPVALRDYAQYRLGPQLSSVAGVARVSVQGGALQEIHVYVDPKRLSLYGLTNDDLVQAVASANVVSAMGRLEDRDKLYLLLADNQLQRLEDVRNVVVARGPRGVTHLGDVADVAYGTAPQWIRVTADGKDAVTLQIFQQPGANLVAIAARIRERLRAIQSELPEGTRLTSWYDQSVLVTQSATSVRDAILIGLGLAMLVLFVFLRSAGTMLIAALVVPAVMACTVLALSVLGLSFNIMTLGGMAAATGLIIDDVIVMVENIVRRLAAARSERSAVVLAAGREYFVPLLGSSLATVIVFAPLALLGGVTGVFFRALSITVAAALTASFLITAFVVPVLAVFLAPAAGKPAPRAPGRFDRAYTGIVERVGRPFWPVALVLLALGGVGGYSYLHIGTGFMPHMDEGGFVIDYRTRPGTALTETDRELRQLEEILRTTPEVETFTRRTGLGLGGDFNEPNSGDFFVRLKPGPRRSIDDVMEETRARIARDLPGVQTELAQLMEDLIGDLTGVPQPIEVKLFAASPDKLIPEARKVARAIAAVPGVVDVKDGVVLAGDALNVRIDPSRAALEDADPQGVARAVDGYVHGTVATQVPLALKSIGVRVWLPPALRRHEEDIRDLPLRAADGHLYVLKRVADVTPIAGQPELDRENLARDVAVTARIEGRDLGSTAAEVKRQLDQPGFLASGVRYELGGLYRQQRAAFAGLLRVFLGAAAAELVLLLFLYESFTLALVILCSALLSTTATFTALWLTGLELNISAIMGMTMVIGIATEMAIFYVSEYVACTRIMSQRAALIEASRNRLRPIAMTTLAAIFTLLPLALGIGTGSAMQQPLAIAIIAGLALQCPLVLTVLPGVLRRLHRSRAAPERV